MSDDFVEQSTDELYSTLVPEEGEGFLDRWNRIGQPLAPNTEVVRALGDVAGTMFRPRWPWDSWNYTDRWQNIYGTVKDLVTGEDLPELEWINSEAAQENRNKDLLEQKADELLPRSEKAKNLGAGDTALKALHFETMTVESAFIKFINWLGSNSIEVAARSGTPLGESLIYEEGPGGAMSLRDQFKGQGGPTAKVIDLRGDEGKNELKMYLDANWQDIEQLQQLVQQKLAISFKEFTAATIDGVRPTNFGTSETDPDLFAEVMRQFGGFGDGTATLATVDDIYGGGSAIDIVGGVVAEAIAEYQTELSSRQNTMLIGSEVLINAEYEDQYDDEGNVTGQTLVNQIGFITSFDGTPYGDVTSVNDLFSGGKIGPLDALPYMEALYRNTKDNTGYSAIIEKIQQELFAWGLLTPGDDIEWGKLDISGMHGRADRTVDALQMFQVDIINEALDVWEENPENLADDATPYMKDVTQRLVARNVNLHDVELNGVREHEQQVLQAVSKRIQDRVAQSGGHRTINAQGIKEVENTIREMIAEMGSQDREEYFGRGGSAKERQIVDSLMADFYQDANWGPQIFFGGSNNDLDFMNYAKGVGALTDEQMDLMRRGKASPENFRSNWGPNDLAGLEAAEKDVVTSNLLKMIANYATDDGGIDANAARRGLITFAHTIGQRTSAEHGYTDRDFARMAANAIAEGALNPAESPLVTTLDDRLAESHGLVGGGDTPDFRNLMDSLAHRRRGQGGASRLKVRDV